MNISNVINTVDSYTELNNFDLNIQKKAENNFKGVLDKITDGKVAEEIRKSCNVTLDVGSVGSYQQLIDTYDISCMNYVRISPETLSNMENNPTLKKKVLSAIEEFCSSEEQSKVKALQPPVKSSGLIINPDGSTLYWLEGYPNNFGSDKNKKTIIGAQSLDNLFGQYSNVNISLTEKDFQSVMQIMATEYKRKVMS